MILTGKPVRILSFIITLIMINLCIVIIQPASAETNHCVMASEPAPKVTVNKASSFIKPIESEGTYYVPLSFPAIEGKSTWQVTVEYDKSGNIVKIEKVKVDNKVRGDTKCQRCNGTGDCQACYPAGSGKNINGDSCGICDGTKKCQYCNGKGNY